jgi:hypothetical protein
MADDSLFECLGTRMAEPPARRLSAGPLAVDLQDGNLRTIRFMGHEVLRAIAFLVRDRDWGTCAPEITGLSVDAGPDHFTVAYSVTYAAPSGARLDCRLDIAGDASGRLEFAAAFCPDADFETARAGFTVLHPIVGLAGRPVEVEHGDGSIEASRWPETIEPWQPFEDIAAIIHHARDGITVETRFAGDVFEMEDQRNWTDASYKTYVRPLALPWPYLLRAGETVRQSVTVHVHADQQAAAARPATGAVTVALTATATPLFDIGVGLRPECHDAETVAAERLARLGVRHLIAHFDPLAGHGLAALAGHAEISRLCGLKVTLECAVPCAGPLERELAEIAELVDRSGLRLDALFVSPAVDRQSTPPGSRWPDCPPLEALYAAARQAFPGLALGGGMLSYFTELNRKRVPGDAIDFVSHCTNPIVHAADDLSVMQSFEALRDVVATVRAIYGDKPYRIGPSTIAMRQNPYGSATKDNPGLARMPMANADPRHNGLFGAAWTLGYAASVADAGLDVLTLSTLGGPFGLVAGPGEPADEGALRPLGHVIGALAALSGRPLVAVETSRPDAILGLGAGDGRAGTVLLLANITASDETLVLGRMPQEVEMLGRDGFASVPVAASLTLEPYGCARIRL